MFSFTRYTSLWFTLSGLILALGFGAAAVWGMNLGIDFTGGTLLETTFSAPGIDSAKIEDAFKKVETIDKLTLGQPVVVPLAEANRFIVRFRYLENDSDQTLLVDGLKRELGSFTVDQFTTTEPKVGTNQAGKALRALAYVLMAIVTYLAMTFRNVRTDSLTKYVLVGSLLAFGVITLEVIDVVEIVRWGIFAALLVVALLFLVLELRAGGKSLKYGVSAIVALFHDVAIVVGFYALMGHFYGVEVDSLAVTALLTVMGFSVHDTIVVFDRLRENLKFQKSNETLADVADRSLNQTLARSINTSMTALITLSALCIFGAESTRWFVAALIVGITIGTYSSIFVATPLYVVWQKKA